MPSISKYIQLAYNMGLRYIVFRVGFEVRKRLGFFKKKFPQNPTFRHFISLGDWRRNSKFFGITATDKTPSGPSMVDGLGKLMEGYLRFFSAQQIHIGKEYDWITNPDTGYQYDPKQHWSEVQDYNAKAGDIKYVWEKSRFSYLYDVIRYDHKNKEDHSKWVFDEIKSWLDANAINSGPNYKCSQEISLRILNWTYALHYYKNSPHLKEELFQEIIHAIYWQLKHVYANINFSRIAVRNNHAITETLTLYLSALFYPFFPEASLWKKKGKSWFEEEISYQIYPDGTFLQFSMNYHRVVIQLFCWAFKAADFYGEKYKDVVYERAYKSLKFLYACQDDNTGWLPNYGNNDGALFFKLSACDFRDFRPQLNTLHVLLTGEKLYTSGEWDEDSFWFDAKKLSNCNHGKLSHQEGWSTFDDGGYYVIRESGTLTFIRCGKHKDRPAQADNLHLDIWHKGQNVLFDGGSYKYNTDPQTLMYFMGTESHNTVMLGKENQMAKGARFIWYNWSQAIRVNTNETDEGYFFEGEISAFRHIHSKIRHVRRIKKSKGKTDWIVEDYIEHKPGEMEMIQHWHALPRLTIQSEDEYEEHIQVQKKNGMRSDYYGRKEKSDQFTAGTCTNKVKTRIKVE